MTSGLALLPPLGFVYKTLSECPICTPPLDGSLLTYYFLFPLGVLCFLFHASFSLVLQSSSRFNAYGLPDSVRFHTFPDPSTYSCGLSI